MDFLFIAGGIYVKFTIGDTYHGFKLQSEEFINEIGSTARVFYHTKSGARLLHLENSDDNKMFSVTFRTTPQDDTGVAHILEHSVLCGSKKYKTKDPFGDMDKSSLKTFLNAMTCTDNTTYPVASRNHKDFMNLMNVYLDAVFYPRIYENHEILRQEGWRYEVDETTGKLGYKGVVHSEMQGALSSPEEVICSEIYKSLFPNTTYAFVSGGAPAAIPELTQEKFEEFHSKFYHPSNSYIILSGDMDIDNCLTLINDDYLADFDKIEVPSSIEMVPAFEKMNTLKGKYSLSEEDDDKDKTFMALTYVFGETKDPMEYLTTKILYNMIVESSASPVKKALLDAGIGECMLAIDDMNMDPTRQLMFPMAVKNTEASKADEFRKVIVNAFKAMAENGIDRDLIEASINSVEFELREADPWRSANRGIRFRSLAIDGWLYDGNPLAHLKYEKNLETIKAGVGNGYFEEYIRTHILENNYCSLVVLEPEKGLADKADKVIEEKLEKYRKSLSADEIQALKDRNEKLRQAQMRKDTKEEKMTIPRIKIEDIDKDVDRIPQKLDEKDGIKILCHEMDTNKIAYVDLYFNTEGAAAEDIPYLALLSDVLGEIDTDNTSYTKLITDINKYTGGISFSNKVYLKDNEPDKFYPEFVLKSKAMASQIPQLTGLIGEIISSTSFNNTKRLREIIKEIKSRLQMKVINSGDDYGVKEIFGQLSLSGAYEEKISGRNYYKFICSIDKNFDRDYKEIAERLHEVYSNIISKNNLLVSIVGDNEIIGAVEDNITKVTEGLSNSENMNQNKIDLSEKKSEGIITASNVQYVVKGFNFVQQGYKYSGKMRVLQNIIENEYLYPRVRLQGGAYGCYTEWCRNGNLAAFSYRDPNLTRTIDIYKALPEFIRTMNIDKDDMVNFIIGTIGRTYRPLTPDRKGEKAVENYITGRTVEDELREKKEILDTTMEELKIYVDLFEKGIVEHGFCVVGNEKNILDNKKIFDTTEYML